MPRYVILVHDHPFLHWDFLLESGDAALTWRLLEQPRPDAAIQAEALPAHRLRYLDYEGPVSGGRGNVTRWDWGEYEEPLGTAKQNAIANIMLSGTRGLTRARREPSNTGEVWYFEAGRGAVGLE
jgi:hypothetical protein